jgi:hypothetical protein
MVYVTVKFDLEYTSLKSGMQQHIQDTMHMSDDHNDKYTSTLLCGYLATKYSFDLTKPIILTITSSDITNTHLFQEVLTGFNLSPQKSTRQMTVGAVQVKYKAPLTAGQLPSLSELSVVAFKIPAVKQHYKDSCLRDLEGQLAYIQSQIAKIKLI